METQFITCLKVFQSHDGGEFISSHCTSHLRSSRIHHHFSCSYIPSQNDRVGHKHHHLTENNYAFFFHSHLSPQFQVDAFSIATYIINCLPIYLTLSHLLKFYLVDLSIMLLFILLIDGYILVYMIIWLTNSHLVSCIFLGYNPFHKGFCCLDPFTSRIYITCLAQFDELHFSI